MIALGLHMEQKEESTHRRSYDSQLAELRQDLSDLRAMLEPVIEVWGALAGLAKVLKWVGIAAKWIITIGGGLAIIWAAFIYAVEGAIHRGG